MLLSSQLKGFQKSDLPNPVQSKVRVAVVHDWLVGMRGGEHVLEAILDLFPTAEIFTLLYRPEAVSEKIRRFPVKISFLQRVPKIHLRYRYFLPLMPFAVELLDVRDFDLVISSSHCVAKGIRKRRGAVHVSYVHSPMRYIWDRFGDYFGVGKARFSVRFVATLLRPLLKKWDRRVSLFDRVNLLIANSQFIAKQIETAYGRPAKVVYPFANLERFSEETQIEKSDPYYLVVSAFAPNKRVDLAVQACLRLGRRLKVVGTGQDEEKLKALLSAHSTRAAQGLISEQIEFLGPLPDDAITKLYFGCRAFLFPGVDDFGITPVEAMAAGKPVIAFAGGGALETVSPETGVFFDEPTVESLEKALLHFESVEKTFMPESCKERAQRFSRKKFQENLMNEIYSAWEKAGKSPELLPPKNS